MQGRWYAFVCADLYPAYAPLTEQLSKGTLLAHYLSLTPPLLNAFLDVVAVVPPPAEHLCPCGKKVPSVHMIDFGHAHANSGDTASTFVDHGYLLGLRSVIQHLAEAVAE